MLAVATHANLLAITSCKKPYTIIKNQTLLQYKAIGTRNSLGISTEN